MLVGLPKGSALAPANVLVRVKSQGQPMFTRNRTQTNREDCVEGESVEDRNRRTPDTVLAGDSVMKAS